MRVLVCGGRNWGDHFAVNWEMEGVHQTRGPITTVIHGCATGVDRFAESWAKHNRIKVVGYRAEWQRLGKAAGPLRNQRMLDEGKPDLVVAFPGGRGTADMVRRAKAAGVEVVEVTNAA